MPTFSVPRTCGQERLDVLPSKQHFPSLPLSHGFTSSTSSTSSPSPFNYSSFLLQFSPTPDPMALLQSFLSHSPPPSFSLPKPTPLSLVSLSQSFKPPQKLPTQAWRDSIRCCAVAEIRDGVSLGEEDQGVLVDPSSQEEVRGERHVAEYDWKEEWYPLYLTKDIPEDAPMGLTVFDKQIVLCRDGKGLLQCYEDRCPHR